MLGKLIKKLFPIKLNNQGQEEAQEEGFKFNLKDNLEMIINSRKIVIKSDLKLYTLHTNQTLEFQFQ